jgi:hypothetical protein
MDACLRNGAISPHLTEEIKKLVKENYEILIQSEEVFGRIILAGWGLGSLLKKG